MLRVLDSGVEIIRRECVAISGYAVLQLKCLNQVPNVIVVHWVEGAIGPNYL